MRSNENDSGLVKEVEALKMRLKDNCLEYSGHGSIGRKRQIGKNTSKF